MFSGNKNLYEMNSFYLTDFWNFHQEYISTDAINVN